MFWAFFTSNFIVISSKMLLSMPTQVTLSKTPTFSTTNFVKSIREQTLKNQFFEYRNLGYCFREKKCSEHLKKGLIVFFFKLDFQGIYVWDHPNDIRKFFSFIFIHVNLPTESESVLRIEAKSENIGHKFGFLRVYMIILRCFFFLTNFFQMML